MTKPWAKDSRETHSPGTTIEERADSIPKQKGQNNYTVSGTRPCTHELDTYVTFEFDMLSPCTLQQT